MPQHQAMMPQTPSYDATNTKPRCHYTKLRTGTMPQHQAMMSQHQATMPQHQATMPQHQATMSQRRAGFRRPAPQALFLPLQHGLDSGKGVLGHHRPRLPRERPRAHHPPRRARPSDVIGIWHASPALCAAPLLTPPLATSTTTPPPPVHVLGVLPSPFSSLFAVTVAARASAVAFRLRAPGTLGVVAVAVAAAAAAVALFLYSVAATATSPFPYRGRREVRIKIAGA